MSDSPRFIHLRLHTEYSLLEGAVPVKKLAAMTRDAGMPAVAVTDSNSMFCALEASVALSKAGVQPIVGCQVDVDYLPASPGEKETPPAAIVLLAQNEAGYANLMKLSTCLYVEAEGRPMVSLDQIGALAEGLICLSGGPDGPVGRHLRDGQRAKARDLMSRLSSIFPGRLYVELQRHRGENGQPEAELLTERGHVEMAYEMGLPLVATNDVYFPNREMFEAHDAMICVSEGTYVDQKEPRRRLTPEHYFKSQKEMAALFADLPEAVENTVEIARRCAFKAEKRDPILPRFADDEADELRRQAEEGLRARLAVIDHAAEAEVYRERLDFELGIIEKMGFPGYFLIVAEFVQWAKREGIPVGPGRGSGAGSLVAYALTITDLDPLRYDLLFERFLNPERVSMPDFDIDFCMDRREDVIRHVKDRYGSDKVGQIITFGALLSKAAVRDVGRVLEMPYGQVDRLSKLIPTEGMKPVSIEKALEEEPRLREEEKSDGVVKRLLNYARQIEGLLRNASTHAAGVVIGDRPLDTLVPLYRDPKSDMPATQFNMKWVEEAGLVKFDFLGLKTLTVIQRAIEHIRADGRSLHIAADGRRLYEPAEGTENDIGQIPLDDEATYRLYQEARTAAVFQVESSGMMDALRRMKPTCIEDIVALVALYRPGPMENIPKYCEVKNRISDRENLHPLIDHILDETQGIIVYQEQVMQIAREMAGYTLGGADLLRRAMGKKIKEAMDAERPKFIEGATKNDVDRNKALEVWNLLEKFANYGFNKSHAAAYAVVSYQTAWLKANHPVEFMAGVMDCDPHLTDKLAVYVDELRRSAERGGMGVNVVNPCVNRSLPGFSVSGGELVYALGALKGVGIEAMRLIVDARGDTPFTTMYDLARRVDLKRVGQRPLEMLARAGAFDMLDKNRRQVFDSMERLVAYSAAVHDQRSSSQVSLFGESGEDLPEPELMRGPDWLPGERLGEEFTSVGFYLSGHPLDDYMPALRRGGVKTLEEVTAKAARGAHVAKMAGVVSSRKERKSSRGNRYAFVQFSDPSGQYEATVFSETLEESRDLLESGRRVILTVEATMEADQLKLLCRSVLTAEDVAAGGGASNLRVFVNAAEAFESVAALFARARSEAKTRAAGEVCLRLLADDLPGEVEIALKDPVPVTPEIKAAARSMPGVALVEEY